MVLGCLPGPEPALELVWECQDLWLLSDQKEHFREAEVGSTPGFPFGCFSLSCSGSLVPASGTQSLQSHLSGPARL